MEHEIISRAEAKAKGLKFYFTGKPCKNGELSRRRTTNCACICEKCSKENSIRSCQWHKDNPEASAVIKKRWSKNNPDKVYELSKNFQVLNREKVTESKRRHRERNKDKMLDRTALWRKQNPEKVTGYSAEYRANNRDKVAAGNALRHSKRIEAIPSWFCDLDEFVLQEAYGLAADRKAATGIEWHVDHMIPMRAKKASGLHCADNIQVIPAVMNLSKSNKMVLTEPLEWLREY